jgi:hypothetical protein
MIFEFSGLNRQPRLFFCPRGETDITAAFEAVVGGSNPPEDTRKGGTD